MLGRQVGAGIYNKQDSKNTQCSRWTKTWIKRDGSSAMQQETREPSESTSAVKVQQWNDLA